MIRKRTFGNELNLDYTTANGYAQLGTYEDREYNEPLFLDQLLQLRAELTDIIHDMLDQTHKKWVDALPPVMYFHDKETGEYISTGLSATILKCLEEPERFTPITADEWLIHQN